MANLTVRDLDDDIVQALKERAAGNRRSAEAEHREILAAVLRRPRRRTFSQVIMDMPNVGQDSDFVRAESGEAVNVSG